MMVVVLFPKRKELIEWAISRRLGPGDVLLHENDQIRMGESSVIWMMSTGSTEWIHRLQGLRIDVLDDSRVTLSDYEQAILQSRIR